MSNEIKKRVHILHSLYIVGISNIADWYKQIPSMQQTEQVLGWIETSLDQSPPAIDTTTDEVLIDYLDKAAQGVAVFNSIPKPTLALSPVINTSGSIIPSVYDQYVYRVVTQVSSNPEVTEWACITIVDGNNYRSHSLFIL